MKKAKYVHGTSPDEQARLAQLNALTNPKFIEFLNVRSTDMVLEIGAGLGILASQVADVAANGQVLAVEFSPEQIARRHGCRLNLHFIRGDAHHLPFEDNTFDVVYCRYVLEHMADALHVISEARRVLKPGGRFLAQENNIAVNFFYPECPRFEPVWLKLAELQEKLGADAHVGKKLFAYFRQVGFKETSISLAEEFHHAGMSSFQFWVENLARIIQASREDFIRFGILTGEEIDAGVAEAMSFSRLPDAAAYFYWNRAVGTK
ncbi:MAG: methyltransferase domain-containing protein [bacterium]|nr:methyltransferase domain-containing protein [bacterium]